MSALNARIKRLESARDAATPDGMPFDERFALFSQIDTWLAERGFEDELAALESGVPIPDAMLLEMRDQAVYCPRRRAFARIEEALAGIGTVSAADLAMMSIELCEGPD